MKLFVPSFVLLFFIMVQQALRLYNQAMNELLPPSNVLLGVSNDSVGLIAGTNRLCRLAKFHVWSLFYFMFCLFLFLVWLGYLNS